MRPSREVAFFELLGGGKRDAGWDRSGMTHHRLAILPGVTQHDISVVPALAATVMPFLPAPGADMHPLLAGIPGRRSLPMVERSMRS